MYGVCLEARHVQLPDSGLIMKINTQRNFRLVGYLLLEMGGGFLFGVALALALFVQVLDYAARAL